MSRAAMGIRIRHGFPLARLRRALLSPRRVSEHHSPIESRSNGIFAIAIRLGESGRAEAIKAQP